MESHGPCAAGAMPLATPPLKVCCGLGDNYLKPLIARRNMQLAGNKPAPSGNTTARGLRSCRNGLSTMLMPLFNRSNFYASVALCDYQAKPAGRDETAQHPHREVWRPG